MIIILICIIAISIMVIITTIVIFTPPQKVEYQEESKSNKSANDKKSKTSKAVTPQSIYKFKYSEIPENVFPTEIEDIDKQTKKTVEQILNHFKPLPSSVFKILATLRDPYASAADISSIVSTDPILSTTLLKVVNSAYFRPTHPVTSIGTAIVLLGFNNVRTLVIKDNITNKKTNNQNKKYYDSLWLHSHTVSVCADFLAKNVFNYNNTDLATTGLLHDIGKYFMHMFTIKKGNDSNSIMNEEKICGINHALLGSLIAEKLQLPKIIGKPIEYHHYPVFFEPDDLIIEPYGKLSFILCLADTICNGMGYGIDNTEIHVVKDGYFKKYGLKGTVESLITPSLVRELEKARALVEAYLES